MLGVPEFRESRVYTSRERHCCGKWLEGFHSLKRAGGVGIVGGMDVDNSMLKPL